MVKGICLDTDICIELLNAKPITPRILQRIAGRKICISSISVFELMLRETNLDQIAFFLSKFDILAFDDDAAKIASTLDKKLKKEGRRIDVRDLFIASICIQNECEFLTLNRTHFERVEGLSLIEF